jgi:hypothetical protein
MNSISNRVILLPVVIISLFTGWHCGGSENWRIEEEKLYSRMMELQTRHSEINSSIDSLWDATSSMLDEALPADLPPVDRNIFLNSRNADHIRMFMSFEKIDPALQKLVNDAGIQDKKLAQALHTLLEEKLEFERDKLDFIRKVEKHDGSAADVFTERLK